MKAIVCTKYGLPKPVELKEVGKPVPEEDEVLVEVHASSVTYSNLLLVSNKMLPFRLIFGRALMPRTRIPGSDMAGRVVATGGKARQFKPGDEVYGDLSLRIKGGYAEYVCAPESMLALKPVNLSFEEAASVPESALVALQGLRDYGKIQKGQKVLIYSASGGIGIFAVQIAKYYGAEVTGVCSTRNLEMVRALGADHVIDYTREDFTKNGQHFDLVFAVRNTRSVWAIKRALSPGGIYVSTAGPSIPRLFQEFIIGPRIFKNEDKKVAVITIHCSQKDLLFIKELIETGKVKPVIDSRFPLSEVTEAYRYYARGHVRGKVVINIRAAEKAVTPGK
jgi:NADPH:quinone reductase-like Zn-dependent oxidoreductase